MPTLINIGPRCGLAHGTRVALFLALVGLFASLPAMSQNRMQETTKKIKFEGPRVAIADRDVDLGTVSRGAKLEHTFTLMNLGNAPLKVLRAESGCSCSVASYDEEIAPGETGSLRVVVDTSQLSGVIGKGVTITTNDAYMSKVRVVVRALVLGSVDVFPGEWAVISNRRPELRSSTFLVRQLPSDTGELLIQRAAASVPWIDVDAERVTERREAAGGLPVALPDDWIIRVSLGDGAPAGRVQQEVRFGTGLKRQPEVTLTIKVDVYPPVSINEVGISLVPGQPKVLLASLRDDLISQPISVTASDGLSVRTEPGQSPRFFKIHLTWDGDPPASPPEFQLDVGRESQTFEVRVSAEE